ncbi:hypothetical protein KCP69_26620 (plasmid) [Salmonella enterica subsp. enterica]|nr:hypothetical protein KCP69_26620 [Salmonella enterica subsp. enterica]
MRHQPEGSWLLLALFFPAALLFFGISFPVQNHARIGTPVFCPDKCPATSGGGEGIAHQTDFLLRDLNCLKNKLEAVPSGDKILPPNGGCVKYSVLARTGTRPSRPGRSRRHICLGIVCWYFLRWMYSETPESGARFPDCRRLNNDLEVVGGGS